MFGTESRARSDGPDLIREMQIGDLKTSKKPPRTKDILQTESVNPFHCYNQWPHPCRSCLLGSGRQSKWPQQSSTIFISKRRIFYSRIIFLPELRFGALPTDHQKIDFLAPLVRGGHNLFDSSHFDSLANVAVEIIGRTAQSTGALTILVAVFFCIDGSR